MIFIDETLHPLGATGYDALAGTQIVKHIKSVDIIAIATVVTVWTAVLTVAIGCFMVMMKGALMSLTPMNSWIPSAQNPADGFFPARPLTDIPGRDLCYAFLKDPDCKNNRCPRIYG